MRLTAKRPEHILDGKELRAPSSMLVMRHNDAPRRWYAACCAFFTVPDVMRRVISRQTLAHYRRIRQLPRDLGEDLDRRSAPLTIVQWVAWGAGEGAQRARHAAAVEHHTCTRRWAGAKD